MQINITQTTEEAQRMFNATVCDGERFLDTVAADTYIQQMQQTGLVDTSQLQRLQALDTAYMVEQELMTELWTTDTGLVTADYNIIHAISTPESLAAVTPLMLDYLWSDPTIAQASIDGLISPWVDVEPVFSQQVWESVNTGSTTMSGKSLTITEYINHAHKLTIEERIVILDAQNYVKEILEKGEDPWCDQIDYY